MTSTGAQADTQATFCATLVDEWARAGVGVAVVAPGSRSTPLALALAADGRIDVQVHHDERCAAFLALGVGVATGRPAIALCTSGTAATHFHAAVVEAHHAGVPLLACTADRPPELRGIGAPQTIDQEHLYGGAVRWYCDPGPADETGRDTWRALAARAVLEAADGPVHLNLPFREPLLGTPGDLPPGRAGVAPWSTPPPAVVPVPVELTGSRPVAVSATRVPPGCAVVPVLGGGRTAAAPNVIAHADAFLRVPGLAANLVPDLVLREGRPPASRVLDEWLDASGATRVLVGPRRHDPPPGWTAVAAASPPEPQPGWLDRWVALDTAAGAAIGAVLADHPEPNEPAACRELLAALPAGAHLVVSSSMPVRDLEWYATPRSDVVVHANRGANGIDGVLSTATGVALATGAPTACLLGDVAFLHDSNALIGLAGRGVDLTVVVIDNDGGGIFSFLPQAGALPPARFEQLFGTPHGVRPEHLAAAHGLASFTVEAIDALAPSVAATTAAGGVHVLVVRTDRAANVALHADLHAAVAAAVSQR